MSSSLLRKRGNRWSISYTSVLYIAITFHSNPAILACDHNTNCGMAFFLSVTSTTHYVRSWVATSTCGILMQSWSWDWSCGIKLWTSLYIYTHMHACQLWRVAALLLSRTHVASHGSHMSFFICWTGQLDFPFPYCGRTGDHDPLWCHHYCIKF